MPPAFHRRSSNQRHVCRIHYLARYRRRVQLGSIKAENLSNRSSILRRHRCRIYKLDVAGLRRVRANLTWTSGTSITVTAIATELAHGKPIETATELIAVLFSLDTSSIRRRRRSSSHPGDCQRRSRTRRHRCHPIAYAYSTKTTREALWTSYSSKTNVAIGTENSAVIHHRRQRSADHRHRFHHSRRLRRLVNSQIATKTNVGLAIEAAAGATVHLHRSRFRDTKTYTAAGITLLIGILQD